MHLAVLSVLHATARIRPAHEVSGQQTALHFSLLAPPALQAKLPASPVRTPRQGHKLASRAVDTLRRALSKVTSAAPQKSEKAPEFDEFAQIAPTPAPTSAAEIMRGAKRDIASISRELSKELPGRGKTFSSDLQNRLDRRFEEAHAAARPEWFQAAKIEEITTARSGGARVYRITTVVGVFCVTYSSSAGRPTYGNCP
jgi:hypothetical protein